MPKKYSFHYRERYAVWACNDHRCWQCGRALRLFEATVDHILPESLLTNGEDRTRVFTDYGLSDDFNINGFENWMPACGSCNSKKGSTPPELVPLHVRLLRRNIRNAGKTKKVAESVRKNITKDKLLKSVLDALEQQKISMRDLETFLISIMEEPEKAGVPKDVHILDSGYWHEERDFVREGLCACSQNYCVEAEEKVYCYFHSGLSDWVVRTGLFWKCYDEVINCPRCGDAHIRGHVGRQDYCENPFSNQKHQCD